MADIVIASNITTKILKVDASRSQAFSPAALDLVYATGPNEYLDIDIVSTTATNPYSFLIKSGATTLFTQASPFSFNKINEDYAASGKKIRVPPSCDVLILNGGVAQTITTRILGVSTVNSP